MFGNCNGDSLTGHGTLGCNQSWATAVLNDGAAYRRLESDISRRSAAPSSREYLNHPEALAPPGVPFNAQLAAANVQLATITRTGVPRWGRC